MPYFSVYLLKLKTLYKANRSVSLPLEVYLSVLLLVKMECTAERIKVE